MRAPRLSLLTFGTLLLGLASALVLVSVFQLGQKAAPNELYLSLPESLSPAPLAFDNSRSSKMATTQSLTYDPTAGMSLSTSESTGSCQLFGDKELVYLDRQHPHCGPHSAMSRFTFQRCTGQDFKSSVDCRGHGNLISANAHYYQTDCQVGSRSMSEYFDRHNIQCPDGQVLSEWHVTTHGCAGYDWLRTEYKCREAETTPPESRETSCQTLRNHPLAYFDRQNPTCNTDEVMTGFRLHSSGCGHNEMRFNFHCAKVLTPWYEYGREKKIKYQQEYEKFWDDYVKYHAEYKHLSYPNSPTGHRLKSKYEYAYKSYRNLQDKFKAIDDERHAIKFERLYRRFSRIPSQADLAQTYKVQYDHYHNLFLAAQGALPEPPKLAVPNTLGPVGANRSDPVYWASVWSDPLHDKLPEKVKNEEPTPALKCGDDCVAQAHSILDGADEGLDGILPADPDWGAFPKELVKDPNTRDAQVEKALSTDPMDPLNNADFEERLLPEGRELADKVGCVVGDAACLRRMGVWPGEHPAKRAEALFKDEDSAADAMHDVHKRLGDLLPDEPEWDEYPKQIVVNPESSDAKLSDALNIQVFNPLDNADIGIVEGGHAERNDFRANLRASTGCDLGEKDCLKAFLAKHPPPPEEEEDAAKAQR